MRINGELQSDVRAGSYRTIERAWQPGDTIELELDMTLRAVAGDLDAAGRVSLYRGPLLLAFDQADNAFDEDAIPTIDVQALKAASRELDREEHRHRATLAHARVARPRK